MTSTRSLKPGFSLMELMIYMAIVGLLLGVAVPALMKKLDKGRESTTSQVLLTVKNAINLYYADTSRYPDTLRDLVRKPLDEKTGKRWDGPYIELKGDAESPEDGWDNELVYRRLEPGAGKPYDLYSWGTNGEDAPEDEWIRP